MDSNAEKTWSDRTTPVKIAPERGRGHAAAQIAAGRRGWRDGFQDTQGQRPKIPDEDV
jgi:hypothetical protein